MSSGESSWVFTTTGQRMAYAVAEGYVYGRVDERGTGVIEPAFVSAFALAYMQMRIDVDERRRPALPPLGEAYENFLTWGRAWGPSIGSAGSLTAEQLQGLACVYCGANVKPDEPHHRAGFYNRQPLVKCMRHKETLDGPPLPDPVRST